jgi:uncharacterized metal-binding protein YceD (DUF177 family)
MSKFALYNIVLKDLKDGVNTFSFELNDEYFKKIDSPEVQKGNIAATVTVQKTLTAFEFNFVLDGAIIIPCDRCLDDMTQQIHHKEKLLVKLGQEFSEEDEMVIIPESESALNIAWFLYEFIVINIPIKHVHPTGECNKTMVTKLKKHITHQKSEDIDEDDSLLDDNDDDDFSIENTQTDPRWDGLQNINDNN